MGQYYSCIAFNDGKCVRFENGFGWKLCESNYPNNPYTYTISKHLYHNPAHLAWVGDYANSEDGSAHERFSEDVYSKAWSDIAEVIPMEDGDYKFDYAGKYMVNHTLKIAFPVDALNEYDWTSNHWKMYPIALLCAMGNGLGGGDYSEENVHANKVGIWSCDVISIEDAVPDGYREIAYEEMEFIS